VSGVRTFVASPYTKIIIYSRFQASATVQLMSSPYREFAGRRLEFGYRRFGTVIPSSKFKQSKKNYLPDTNVSKYCRNGTDCKEIQN